MGAQTLISVEDYLHTSYSPDREYRDGVLVERNVGDEFHALLQNALGAYIRRRRRSWNVEVYTELRVRVREGWYPIPDVAVYSPPPLKGTASQRLPLLWIEILSPRDLTMDVWARVSELVRLGVPNVWLIDPETLRSELRTAEGIHQLRDKTLRLPGTEIVIPLEDVVDE